MLEGRFEFGTRGNAHVQVLSCLRRILYPSGLIRESRNWARALLLAQNELAEPTVPPYDLDTECVIWASTCNRQQADVRRRIAYLPYEGQFEEEGKISLSNRLTIVQESSRIEKSKMIALSTLMLLRKGVPFMIIDHSNKAVNVNALRLVRKLVTSGKSTQGIYRLLPDASEAIYSQPDVTFREYDDYLGDNAGGVSLRSTPQNPPLDTTLPNLSDMERRCLDGYLDEQLTGTQLDLFSLAAHIKRRLLVVAAHDFDWTADNEREFQEHILPKQLSVAYAKMESWNPVTSLTFVQQQ